MPCELCEQTGGELLWRDTQLRVVRSPIRLSRLCRVIWSRHVKEMTDLPETDRNHFMAVVFAVGKWSTVRTN